MTNGAETDPPTSEREFQAQRLGFALRGLAADLVSERQKVAELRRDVAELRSQLASRATSAREPAGSAEPLEACPPWARWNGEIEQRYTLGVEEEVMLLEPRSGSLAQSGDRVLAQLSDDLSLHASPETDAAVIELRTGIHANVAGAVGELAGLRRQLAHELDAIGLSAAAAGTHPLTVPEETTVSGAARYGLRGDSLRSLVRREPTMALHVHVGVPDAEDAIRVVNGLRRSVPLLLALSANSPFTRGGDGGFDSMRTMIVQAFPRTGLPRPFASYADYVDALDAVIGAGAVTEPDFFWWDVRPQPRLGTVEVRLMDAQSTVADVAPLVALVQSLSRLELEGDSPPPAPRDEILAENRFLAARDGMAARLIDPASGRLIPVRAMLDGILSQCRPHALALGCASELEEVWVLAAAGGAERQRALTAANGGLIHLVPQLASLFVPSEPRPSADVMSAATTYKTTDMGG